MFEASGTLGRIYIPAEDTETTYRRVCSEFKEVNAAGGLVSNRRGDYLLISRNGLWDLPKGHQEAGEDIRTTAMREVQ
ncbi:MAG: NUDIX domain-containing protein [Bacteroidales bacterium]|nr:NUDIX domain-containing protein [Bacteroidales bacterium]